MSEKKDKKTKSEVFVTASDYLTYQPIPLEGHQNYGTAINFLTVQSSKINAVTNQINFLTTPAYQPNLITAVAGVQSHMTVFSSVQSLLPKIDHLYISSPILDYSRQATLAVSALSVPITISSLVSSVGANYKPWYEENIAKSSILSATASSIALTTPTQSVLGTIGANPSSVFSTIGSFDTSRSLISAMGVNSVSTFALQSGIVKATEYSMFAEKSLYGVTTANMGSRLTLGTEAKAYLTSSFIGLSGSYSTLLKSFESNPDSYAQISPSLTRIAPMEYFSSANLLEAISVDEDITAEEELLKNEIQYENEIQLSSHLPRIDAGLYKMWKGAIEAYHSDNSDKVRHFSTSIRELYTHLMHILAPEDAIKKWTSDPTYYHEGRPTRKARLLFICRNINNDPFNSFVKKDVDATIAFIEIFQKGTHDIDPIFSPNHLVAIKSKAENTLKFLLEIHFTTNN